MRRFESYNSEDIALQMARHRVHKIRRFYTHLFIYTVGILIYIAKTYFGAPFHFWPIVHISSTFMAIWTFILVVQGLRLFFREMIFGTDWEQRKMQEFMNKEQQNKWL